MGRPKVNEDRTPEQKRKDIADKKKMYRESKKKDIEMQSRLGLMSLSSREFYCKIDVLHQLNVQGPLKLQKIAGEMRKKYLIPDNRIVFGEDFDSTDRMIFYNLPPCVQLQYKMIMLNIAKNVADSEDWRKLNEKVTRMYEVASSLQFHKAKRLPIDERETQILAELEAKCDEWGL